MSAFIDALNNFALVMKGVQTSLFVMVILGLVALIIGVVVGALAGYYRGTVDTFLMRFTDLVITLPVIVLGAVRDTSLATRLLGSTAEEVTRRVSCDVLIVRPEQGETEFEVPEDASL